MPLFASYADFRRLELKVDALLHQAGIERSLIIHQEASLAKTLADIEAATAQILAKAKAEGDAVTAIAGVLNDVKAQNATLLQELAAANASGDQVAIDAAIANLQTANDQLDANATATAALEGTAPPAPEPAPTPAPTPTPPVGARFPVPVIASITPAVGTVVGGDTVSINGIGLGNIVAVTFGGNPAPSIIADSDTIVTVTTPSGTAGDVDVVVTTAGGSSVPQTFTYA